MKKSLNHSIIAITHKFIATQQFQLFCLLSCHHSQSFQFDYYSKKNNHQNMAKVCASIYSKNKVVVVLIPNVDVSASPKLNQYGLGAMFTCKDVRSTHKREITHVSTTQGKLLSPFKNIGVKNMLSTILHSVGKKRVHLNQINTMRVQGQF